MEYYSNGKLLLTGEYVVLDGAKSFALPTKFGQDLSVQEIREKELVWGSFSYDAQCWFEARFSLPNLRLISATFNSDIDGSSETIAETLLNILQEAKKMNPDFLELNNGLLVKTTLGFPKNWGLGSSSTLINNIASWANVNPFNLLWNSFSGSGYDIACAKSDSAIFYHLEDKCPVVEELSYNPVFADELFFVYLNKKQNSRQGIEMYKSKRNKINSEIKQISKLSEAFYQAGSSKDLHKIIEEHERIVNSIIKQEVVKDLLFKDYYGSVKSLGAWGGDFVLVTGNDDTKSYFNKKGYTTILTYNEMIKTAKLNA